MSKRQSKYPLGQWKLTRKIVNGRRRWVYVRRYIGRDGKSHYETRIAYPRGPDPRNLPKPLPKGAASGIVSARTINAQRSNRAQTAEKRTRARHTKRKMTKENLNTWARDPGHYDIQGIDTPK